MLKLLKNQLVTGKLVSREHKDEVTDENGRTFNIKRPPRFARNDSSTQSAALAVQDIITGSVNVAVNQYAKVHLSVGDIEHVKSFNDLMSNQSMKSAASTLAHQYDDFLQKKLFGLHSYVGHVTAANNIGAPAEFMPVHTRLMNQGVPNSDLVSTILFEDAEEIRGSLVSGNIQGVNKNALERSKVPIMSDIESIHATPALTLT